MRFRALLPAICLAVLSACAGAELRPAAPVATDLPRFAPRTLPRGIARSNTQIASDFMQLLFQLESGENLRGLLKYEHPVRVAIASRSLASFQPELSALLNRLRTEAGIDITQVAAVSDADIRIESVPARALRRAAPGAACFIAPGVTGWAEFRRLRWRGRPRWSDQTELRVTSVFIPDSAPPQEVRDCLHEEIAQALGPVNDIYRIADTVFNDDNYHSILTPFDMLILRVLYADDLSVGMPPNAVAARLPGLLARLNPKGNGARAATRAAASPLWEKTIEIALNRSNNRGKRRQAAADAVRLARAMRPTDHRLGFAYMTLGRLTLRDAPQEAAEAFLKGYETFRVHPGRDDVRTAQAALHLGFIALHDGRPDAALSLVGRALPVARASENALLLSGLLAVRAATMANIGRKADALAAQAESLKWARYAFGDEQGAIARAQQQIASFALIPDADAKAGTQ